MRKPGGSASQPPPSSSHRAPHFAENPLCSAGFSLETTAGLSSGQDQTGSPSKEAARYLNENLQPGNWVQRNRLTFTPDRVDWVMKRNRISNLVSPNFAQRKHSIHHVAPTRFVSPSLTRIARTGNMTKLWQINFEKKNPNGEEIVGWVSADSVEQAEQFAFNSGARLSPTECFAWTGKAGQAFMWSLPHRGYA